MGCVFKRGKKFWVKYYKDGVPFAESTHSDKIEVAKRHLPG
jgi:hypothetical protein